MRFVDFFIRRVVFAIVCAILIVIAGTVVIPGLPIAQYPQIALPQVVDRFLRKRLAEDDADSPRFEKQAPPPQGAVGAGDADGKDRQIGAADEGREPGLELS